MENKENNNIPSASAGFTPSYKRMSREESQIREMQNRIRMLEVDNEIMKSQLISSNSDTRHAFMELVEKIEYLESKLVLLVSDDKINQQQSLFYRNDGGMVPLVNMAEANSFDALTCVETVMETNNPGSPNDLQIHLEGISATPEGAGELGNNKSGSEGPDSDSSPPAALKPIFSEEIKKRFDCSICGKSFSQSSGLSRHHKIHLKQQQAGAILADSDKLVKPKRFFCTAPSCKSAFTSRSGMTKHAKNFHHDPSIKPLIIPLKQAEIQSTSAEAALEADVRAVVNRIIETTISLAQENAAREEEDIVEAS